MLRMTRFCSSIRYPDSANKLPAQNLLINLHDQWPTPALQAVGSYVLLQLSPGMKLLPATPPPPISPMGNHSGEHQMIYLMTTLLGAVCLLAAHQCSLDALWYQHPASRTLSLRKPFFDQT